MAPPLLSLFWAVAFATSVNTNNDSNSQNQNLQQSPWSPAEWRFDLNFGREANTYMPTAWGASGARLVLPVDVLIESTSCKDDKADASEREFLGGSGKADRLCVLEDSVYVSQKGQQTVIFEPEGAWKINQRRTGKPGDAGQLRFYLDIAQQQQRRQKGDEESSVVAARNDVTLLAERYYCTAKCWRTSELESGLKRFRPIQNAVKEAQRDIDERLEHETGDRRLDGTNPIETALASIDMAVLVKKRDDLLAQLREAERTLPSTSSSSSSMQQQLSKPGMWPGTTERLVIAPGLITVKRKVGNPLLGGGEEYHIVGTWTATPYEGLSEYVEEEEEEDDDPVEDSRSAID